MPLWFGVTGRVRPAREAAAVEEIKRSSANRAGPLPNQDRRRADRNRIRRTCFDDDVALPGGRRSANEHRHAPRSDRAADVWLRSVHERADVRIHRGAPRGLACNQHGGASRPRPERCSVCRDIASSCGWCAHRSLLS